MALAQGLASPLVPSNVSLFNNAPVINLKDRSPLAGGESVCGAFWGDWDSAKDCLDAVEKLPTGDTLVPYTIDRGFGNRHLPQAREHGDCMIQVEMAGQRTPSTIQLIPDHVRTVARILVETCSREKAFVGGFMFGNLHNMKGWLSSPEGEIDKPMPYYTAFPTISISTIQSDWLSPGNYDPVIPHVLAQDIFVEAKKMPLSSRMAAKLRGRATRLLAAEKKMEPRGRRIPWWEDPGRAPRLGAYPMAAGNATADAVEAESQVMVALPGSEASGRVPGNDVTSTAKMARRRRRTSEEGGVRS
ncbi:MAG: hypothetical protein Q9208_003349 [Pyrenodesmia sp. 3 TL-2023]